MLMANLNTVLWPEQASEFAHDYDVLFLYITAVITVGGLGVFAALTWFCFRFAAKPGGKSLRILGSDKIELVWTAVPALFFLSFFVWGTWLFVTQVSHIPADAPEVYVVGKQWMWKIQHPNGVREINELHLPVGRAVKLTLTSEDVIHDFGVPAFRNKIDVMPGRYVSTWYKPTVVGEYWIFCDQYCGQGHSQMVGKVHVMTEEDYAAWLEGHKLAAGEDQGSESARPADGSAAWYGQQLFLKLNCITCHNNRYDTDPGNMNSSNRAPNLEGLYQSHVPLQGGKTTVADDGYLRDSIRNPTAKVRDGWKPIMPAFTKAQVSEDELIQVVAYIKWLKAGRIPRRTDQGPAPIGAPVQDSQGGQK